MNENNAEKRNAGSILRARATHRKWVAVLLVLALAVSAGTLWAFHYKGIAATYQKQVLDCHAISGTVSHIHNADDCYRDGELVCPLEEIEPHEHTEACYTAVLTCGQEENDGHHHTDDCFIPQMELTCGMEESDGDETHPAHHHTADCYSPVMQLVCGLEETAGDEIHPAHWHTEECYEEIKLPVCGMEEGEGAHHHTEECYELVLTCEKQALPLHVHGPECFRTEEMTEDEIAALNLAGDSKNTDNIDDADVPAAAPAEGQEGGSTPEDGQKQQEENSNPDNVNGSENETDNSVTENGTETDNGTNTTDNTNTPAEGQEGGGTPEDLADVPMQTTPFSFASRAGDVLITVEAPAEAFPAGTEMKVRPVYDEQVLSDAADAVEKDESVSGKVVQVQAVDISFWYSGKEVEPLKPIRVVMTPVEAPEFDEQTVVHVDDVGEASLIEQEDVAVPEAAFEVEEFSVYCLVYTKLETTVLASDGNNYKITVTAPDNAPFPENAKLWASEIVAGANAYGITYNEYLTRTEYALGWDAGSATYVRLFDIFVGDQYGNKLPLTTPVDVKIQLLDKEADKESKVVHFGTKTEVVTAETSGQTVSFEASSFSVYAIASAIEKEVIATDGHNYRVSVVYGEDAGIPDGAELVVREIVDTNSENGILVSEYTDYIEKTENALKTNERVAFARFFDITIMANGIEVQPAAPVEVRIELADDVSGNVKAVHFTPSAENPGTTNTVLMNVERADPASMENAVSFEANSFSVYGVVAITDSGEYVFHGEGYLVRVTIPNGVQLPKGTRLVVSEIDKASDEYIQLLGKTWLKINREYFEVREMRENYNEGMGLLPDIGLLYIDDARFFNISFLHQGEEIDPGATITVDIELEQGLNSTAETNPGGAVFSENDVALVDGITTNSDSSGVVRFNYTLDTIENLGAYITQETHDVVVEPIIAPPPVMRAYQTAESGGLRAALRDGENEALNPPTASKTLTPNNPNSEGEGDGTYTLSLSVKGESHSSTITEVSKSNVLIVMDRSSSMVDNYAQLTNVQAVTGAPVDGVTYYGREQHNSNYRYFPIWYTNGNWYSQHYDYSGTVYPDDDFVVYNGTRYTGTIESRMTAEQTALSSMISSLLSHNSNETTPDGVSLTDVIEVSIISFGDQRYAGKQTEVGWTTSYDALMSGVLKNTTTSGTNWEDALKYAKEIADAKKQAQPDEDVFVIFLTDGEPTAYYGESGGAHHYNNVGGGFVAAYEPARDDALALVFNEDEELYHLYGIFTYGSGEEQLSYLKRLINYAYSKGTNDTANNTPALQEYFYDASDTSALLSAFENIISSITDSIAYGRVQIEDGVTSDASTMTVVSGHADGFRYSVSGNVGELYSVTASGDPADPDVAFTIGTQTYSGTQVQKKTDPNNNNKVYYSVTVGEGTSAREYKMALASIDDDNKVTWDLSAIGTLMDGYTYTVSFIIWPNQEAYDYVAGLNNNLAGYTWNTNLPTYEDLTSTKGYEKGGVAGYPSIVRYPNGVFSVLTNTDQKITYSIVNTTVDEITGETTTTYDGPYELPLDPPEPMELTGTSIQLVKKWEDELKPSHADIPKVVLDLTVDGEVYYPNIELTNSGHWSKEDFSIAPGLMVSEGHDAYSSGETYLTYNGVSYAVLDSGHDYIFTEQKDTYDYGHFELTAYSYHPMLIDGDLCSVTFIYDNQGKITGVEQVDEMTSIGATNRLKGGINITKQVVVGGNVVDYDGLFSADVTLTAPTEEIYDHSDQYTTTTTDETTGEPIVVVLDESVAWYAYYNGDQRLYDSDLIELGILEPDGVDSAGYPAGKGTNHDKAYGSGWFMLDFDNSTHIATGTVLLTTEYTLRFVNMAHGVQYTLVETGKNGMTDSYSFTHKTYEITGQDEQGKPTYGWVTTTDGNTHEVIGNAENNIDVTNTASTIANIRVIKRLQGYEWNGESYYVKLDSTATLPKITKTALSNASGSDDVLYDFGNIHFGAEGTYTYTFTEYDENWDSVLSGTMANGIRYGDVVTVTVTVAMVDGKLQITGVTGAELSNNNTTITATIINKAIPLFLYKIGDANPDNPLSGIQFKLYSSADCSENSLLTTDSRGNGIGTAKTVEGVTTYDGVLETGTDGTVKIGFLDPGTYYLQEINTADGYNMLSGAVTVTVSENGTVSYLQTDYSKSSQYNSAHTPVTDLVKANGGLYIMYASDGTTVSGYAITVNNSSGTELPMTGGPGMEVLEAIGGIMMALAFVALVIRKRRMA